VTILTRSQFEKIKQETLPVTKLLQI